MPIMTSPTPRKAATGAYAGSTWSHVFFCVLLLVVMLAAFLVPANASQHSYLRLGAAIAAAGIGSLIPGFVDLKMGLLSASLRAGGAVALFFIVYFFNPADGQQSSPSLTQIRASAITSPPGNQFTHYHLVAEVRVRNGVTTYQSFHAGGPIDGHFSTDLHRAPVVVPDDPGVSVLLHLFVWPHPSKVTLLPDGPYSSSPVVPYQERSEISVACGAFQVTCGLGRLQPPGPQNVTVPNGAGGLTVGDALHASRLDSECIGADVGSAICATFSSRPVERQRTVSGHAGLRGMRLIAA